MKPITRLEHFLAKIAKDPDAKKNLTPITRKEYYLNEIANNADSGSGGGGVTVVTVAKQNNGAKGGGTKAQPTYTFVADKTVAEIQAAALTGAVVFQIVTENNTQLYTLADVMPNGTYNYDVEIGGSFHHKILGADAADDYPTVDLSV